MANLFKCLGYWEKKNMGSLCHENEDNLKYFVNHSPTYVLSSVDSFNLDINH